MINELLSEELVATDLAGESKEDVIRALFDVLKRSGKIKDPETALQDLLASEARMSTGMENGIAIPHAKTDAVDELVACVGVSKAKIEFECIDNKPAQIFIMTLSPKDGTGPHVRFLAEIGRLLKDKNKRKKMLAAKTPSELLAVITA